MCSYSPLSWTQQISTSGSAKVEEQTSKISSEHVHLREEHGLWIRENYLCNLLVSAGKYDDAIGRYERLVKEGSINLTLKAMNEMAGVYEIMHDYNDTTRLYKEIVKRCSDLMKSEEGSKPDIKEYKDMLTKAKFALAHLFQNQCKIQDAISYYEEIIRTVSNNNEEDRRANFHLANLYKKIGRFDKAAEIYQKLQSLMPSGQNPVQLLSAYASGLPADYNPAMESVVPRNIVSKYFIEVSLADIYEKNKEYNKALEIYEDLIEKAEEGPQKYFIMYLTAQGYKKQGKTNKTIEILENIIESDKDRIDELNKSYEKRYGQKAKYPLQGSLIAKTAESEIEGFKEDLSKKIP